MVAGDVLDAADDRREVGIARIAHEHAHDAGLPVAMALASAFGE